ncbi:hypothetical protein COLO4_07185 [Corchorus olitorius]|uniref:DUF4220 domain-containing protein n=1 Tax=Corchorus olitorius TaxID=93759 RepID=A0A1R3KKH6_9ROSI|nr:hypothetical protein COLO4_07185 [Corchorus olitorius]
MSQNLFPRWLTKLWDSWDVRLMVLSSLTVQVILLFLGSRRKYSVKSWLRIILWFTYLIADWIATAALGKLSEAQAKTNPINIAEGTIPVFDIDTLVENPEKLSDEQKLVMTDLWNINMDYLLQTLNQLKPADLYEILEDLRRLSFLVIDNQKENVPKKAEEQKKMRHFHTEFRDVPICLKEKFSDSFSLSTKSAFIAPRGENALEAHGLKEDLRWSIELDFDESIITWHLVTDLCYHGMVSIEDNINEVNNAHSATETKEEKVEDTCQVISNYMMYVLVMQPDIILPGYRKDFWFSHVSETLGGFFEKQRVSNKDEQKAYELLGQRMKSRGALELEENAWKIVKKLQGKENRWNIIESVWLEMLCYAAIACQHINHARQLRRGGEYLTHLWPRLTMSFLKNS